MVKVSCKACGYETTWVSRNVKDGKYGTIHISEWVKNHHQSRCPAKVGN